METLNQAVGKISALLLDFDGPVSPLMPPPTNARAADAVRRALTVSGALTSNSGLTSNDHLALVRAAGIVGGEVLQAAERAALAAEMEAADTARLTEGARELLAACSSRGISVVIVSNNAAPAIELFLTKHGLGSMVHGVVGRRAGHPELMKPDPHLVREGLRLAGVGPEEAIFVGDSVSDIEVSRITGVTSVGFAKHVERGRELSAAGADYLVSTIGDLADAIVAF